MCVGVKRIHIVPDVVLNKPEGPGDEYTAKLNLTQDLSVAMHLGGILFQILIVRMQYTFSTA